MSKWRPSSFIFTPNSELIICQSPFKNCTEFWFRKQLMFDIGLFGLWLWSPQLISDSKSTLHQIQFIIQFGSDQNQLKLGGWGGGWVAHVSVLILYMRWELGTWRSHVNNNMWTTCWVYVTIKGYLLCCAVECWPVIVNGGSSNKSSMDCVKGVQSSRMSGKPDAVCSKVRQVISSLFLSDYQIAS